MTTRRGRPPGPAKAAVTVRLTAEARAVLDSLPGGPSAAVERLLLAAKSVPPTKSAAWGEAYAIDQRLFRQEIMAEPRTHEDFACAFCGKPVPIGNWPIVHDPRHTWATGWPCCSEECARELARAGGMVRHLTADDHDRAWMRRRIGAAATPLTDCGACGGTGTIEDDCGSAVECEACWGHGTVERAEPPRRGD